MKMKRILVCGLALLMVGVLFTGCQSQEAQSVDEDIRLLVYTHKRVYLDAAEDLYEMKARIDALSEEDRASLENLEQFEEVFATYQAKEDEAVAEAEERINKIPALEEMKLAAANDVDKASNAYYNVPEIARGRVSNYAVLEAAKQRIKEIKEACRVKCERCSGYGKVTCGLCKGTGSRLVWHQTPNGKFQVSQDCPTSRECSGCDGRGYNYIEEETEK